jgi:hypothetical protein
LCKKLEAAAVMIEPSHEIVCHGSDEDCHHEEHDRRADPRKEVDEQHDAAQQFTKGDEECNGGDEEGGQNLVFRNDKSEILQVQKFLTSYIKPCKCK